MTEILRRLGTPTDHSAPDREMYLNMTSDNESQKNPFDPCGETSPDGCASCPNNTECYPHEHFPQEVSPFVQDFEPHHVVVEAYITFHMENGEVNVMGLEEFLENSGYFDDPEGWPPLEDLIAHLRPFGLETPLTITDQSENVVEIDWVGKRLEIGTPQQINDLRNVERMIRSEDLGGDDLRLEDF